MQNAKSLMLLMSTLFALLLSACGDGRDDGREDENTSSSTDDLSNSNVEVRGLLVAVEDDAQLLKNVQDGFNQTAALNVERFNDEIFLDASLSEDASDSSSGSSSSSGFTSTYTLEVNIDEHDYVKYDGSHLFIAPTRSMNCCFIIDDIFIVDDTSVVQDEIVQDEIVQDDVAQAVDLALLPPQPEGERSIRIVATDPSNAGAIEVSSIALDDELTVEGLYTNESQLVAISSSGWWGSYGDDFARVDHWQGQITALDVYDISNISEPAEQMHIELQGGFVDSRKKGNMLYVIMRYTPNVDGYIYYPDTEQAIQNESLLSEMTVEDVLPNVMVNGSESQLLAASDCDITDPEHVLSPNAIAYPTMTLMIAVNLVEQSISNTRCYFERTDGIYVSDDAIYLTQLESDSPVGADTRTFVHSYALSESLTYLGSGVAAGSLYLSGNRDFRINQHEGYIRLVTTQYTNDSADRVDHQLSILQLNPEALSLDLVATLPNNTYPQPIGKPNEELYGVRFFGDKLYLVTFERIDPLYVLDLTDQTDPVIAGELTVTGFSDFLHPVSDELLMGLGQGDDGLVKLELFNVAGTPYSLGAISLGKDDAAQSSYSEARYNRHAFTYQVIDESNDRFLVPATLGISSEGFAYQEEDRLYMFEVNGKDNAHMASINAIGNIQAPREGWQVSRSRSVIHDDAVYYINGTDVWSALWTDPLLQNGPQ